jgi:hypothetical protein
MGRWMNPIAAAWQAPVDNDWALVDPYMHFYASQLSCAGEGEV